MSLCVEAYALCHIGTVRSNNEDNFYLQRKYRARVDQKIAEAATEGSTKRFLAAVADGMGGEQKGEFASLEAVKAMRPAAFGDIAKIARESVLRANGKICSRMRDEGARMGSTLTALYLADDRAVCVNIGDSRVYLLRQERLTRLTKDHNKAQQLIDLNFLSPEKARSHPSRHELTRHLGVFPEEMELSPDVSAPMDLRQGDCFLMCSDGLYDALTDEQIARILLSEASLRQKTKALVDQALAEGSRDNVTALVVQIRDRMDAKVWIRGIIKNMNPFSEAGKSPSCWVKAAMARFSSWKKRISALFIKQR